MTHYFDKLPGEAEAYQINWSGRLDGEAISASQWGWYVELPLTAINSGTASGTGSALTQVVLSGGSAGSAYTVSAWIRTTGSARTLMTWFEVRVGGVTA